MATSRIDRTDDTAAVLKIIATQDSVEDAVTKQWQGVYVADATSPAANKLAILATGEAEVTLTTAIPAGTNNIGDVDVLTVPAPLSTTGGGLEATALRVTVASDSTGVLSVDDNAGSLTVDGTFWQATQPVSGTFWQATQPVSGTVTANAGTNLNTSALNLEATQADVRTSVQKLDNIAHAGADVALVEHVPISGQLDDTATTTVTENQIAPVRITSSRALHVAQQGAIPAGANNIGDVDVLTVPAPLSTAGGGTEATALRVTVASDSTGVLSIDDNASSLTIDNSTLAVVGTGTEAAAMRVTIASDSTGLLSVDDNGTNLSVDWAGTVPPIGAGTEAAALRVTLATDSTGLVSVDDNAGSLTVDGTVTANAGTNLNTSALNLEATQASVLTSVQLTDDIVHSGDAVLSKYAVIGAVLDDTATVAVTENQAQSLRMSTRRALLVEGVASGTNVNVNVNAALPAGANNIGDVDVLTVPAPLSTTGGGTEATALRVTVATDSTGVLSVDDNGGTLTVDQATAANLKAEVVGPTADNAANPTAKLAVLSGVALAVAPTRTEGNVNPLRLNLAGDAAVTLDGEAVVLGAGAATIGALTANQSVNVAQINGVTPLMGNGITGTGSPRVTIASDNTAFTVNVGTFPDNEPFNEAQINGVAPLMGNGVTGTGSQRVTIASDNTAFAVNATLSAETTKVIGTVRAQGNLGAAMDSATAAAVPANAIYAGRRGATANPTAVTDGQMVGGMADKLGRTVVVNGHVRDLVAQNATSTTGATEVTVLAAGAAGVFHDLTFLQFANTSATGVRVDIRDATAGAVIDVVYVPATQTVGKVYSVPFKQTTAANNWTMQASSAITTLYVTVQAVKNL